MEEDIIEEESIIGSLEEDDCKEEERKNKYEGNEDAEDDHVKLAVALVSASARHGIVALCTSVAHVIRYNNRYL